MAGLDTGKLNRRIRFERKVQAEGFESAGQWQWTEVATVWAEVQDVLPSRAERTDDGLSIANRPARIRLRYRTDIDADMRIVIGSLDQPDDPPPAGRRILEIIAGPAELGDRDGIELMAENYSTSGGGA